MDLKKVISQKNYDVIRPSFDTLFKISFPFFVQKEIPCYSLRKMMGQFPSGEETTSSLRLLRVFYMFFTEMHGRGLGLGLGLVVHAPSD